MIIIFRTFLGPYQPEKLEYQAYEAPWGMLIAPIILAILVIGIFIFPNTIGYYLLRPAMASIFPTFPKWESSRRHISAWHGFKAALMDDDWSSSCWRIII